jgi:hypothetical protein
MSKFDDMFDRLSSASDQRQKEHAEQTAREHEERERTFEEQKQMLLRKVEPSIEEAKARFESRGVPVRIENNWTHGRGMFPTLEFKCEGEDRPNSIGGKYRPQGRAAFFSIRDGEFRVGLAREGFGRHPEEMLSGSDEEMVEKAVEEALASYFRSIEEGERPR